MTEDKRLLLLISSRLLGYPSEGFSKEKYEIQELIEEISNQNIKEEIHSICIPLFEKGSRQIQELYVETFDLKSKLGLYLTAHELGDSNRRGAALIKLQKIISEAGFERSNEELVDYIPMLMEFLAAAKESPDVNRLFKRMAVVIQYIYEHMDKDNPYTSIFSLLMKYVFPTPTAEEIKQLEDGREEADLEELPYPIMYQ
jgi:nitrate reductase molybdenum cofactor assembly chaperone NarJ/NarW